MTSIDSTEPDIPVSSPSLDGEEKRYLIECIETGWISSEGPFVQRFERDMARQSDREHGVAVSSGSAALDAALAALDLEPGDEVLIPSLTIISCAAAVIRAGGVPVVVDCDSQTWNMAVVQVEERISARTRAVMPVHIYGLPVDMDPLLELADRFSLRVIEDAAQAHGQTYRGRPCGSFGELSTFSFYANKLISCGEGGMILTDDTNLASRCRALRDLCHDKTRRFRHEELGWNFRMSNVQAAMGVAQLERLGDAINKKRAIGALYTSLLGDDERLQLPISGTDYASNHYWAYGVVLDDTVPFDALEAIRLLSTKGVGCRPFFWPIHEQPVLRRMGLFADEHLPNAERAARRGFYMPSGLGMTEGQIERAAASLKMILR